MQPKVKKTRVHCQKVIHPNSRKATKLTRKAHRADKLLRCGFQMLADNDVVGNNDKNNYKN